MELVSKKFILMTKQLQICNYSIGLVFLSYMNRWNLVETVATKIGLHKLMQPGEHESWTMAFEYLARVEDILFNLQNQVLKSLPLSPIFFVGFEEIFDQFVPGDPRINRKVLFP